jgi:hypothetical protein
MPPLRAPRASSTLASCLAVTAFLLAAVGAGAALFLLFRPRARDIAVAAVRLPSFTGGELGSVYIPVDLIDGGRTKDISTIFNVHVLTICFG